jgi:hypothetical protein
MNVMIATPASLGLVTAAYATALYDVCAVLSERGIQSSFSTVTMADIEQARNYLASKFLADETSTHLMFIDADMGFRRALIRKMIELQKEFVGTIYVSRHIDLYQLMANAGTNVSTAPDGVSRAISRAMRFVGSAPVRESDGSVLVRNGFAKFEHTGMGVCLLTKSVLQRMVTDGKVEMHADAPRADPSVTVYGFLQALGEGLWR